MPMEAVGGLGHISCSRSRKFPWLLTHEHHAGRYFRLSQTAIFRESDEDEVIPFFLQMGRSICWELRCGTVGPPSSLGLGTPLCL